MTDDLPGRTLMDRSVTQHAAGAAEAINGLNHRILAALADSDDSDLTRLKDAYEAVASLKLLSQRLTLTATEMQRLVSEWHQEGRLQTGHEVDANTLVNNFSTAMTDASKTARVLFNAFDDATQSLGPIGWRDSVRGQA
jgi:hypothetical protein